jgi:tetratricopeptide (TPR) repeat protein
MKNDEWHPSPEALARFLENGMPDEESGAVQRHISVCPGCEERLTRLLPLPGGGPTASGTSGPAVPPRSGSPYRKLIRRVLDGVRSEAVHRRALLKAERAAAAGLWKELKPLGEEERRLLVWRDRRFQSWGLFELLIERARHTVLEDPQRAEALLRLALDVTEHLDPDRYGPGSVDSAKGRTWIWLGNALRILTDFRRAEQAFQTAELHFTRSWLDPLDEALLLELKSSLRRAQRRFDEAHRLLDEAIGLYREVNEPHPQGRALMTKGLTFQYMGEFDAAIHCYRTSLFLLDGCQEPRLLVLSQVNLINTLHDSGRTQEAAILIPEARQIMLEVGKRADLLRLRWIEAKIAASLGRIAEAEEAYVEVREGLVEDRAAYDAALAGLELSALYARAGRAAEMKGIAAEILPIFQSCEVHREAIAALIVFQKAAEMEQLTLGLVEEVATFLDRVRTNPSLRFRESDRQAES